MKVDEPSRTIAYVSSAGTREIFIFNLDYRTGALHPLAAVLVPGPEGPSPTSMPMALCPDREYLFAALRSGSFPISSFSINPATGHLTLVSTVPLVDNVAYIATDRSGRFLLAASYEGSKLSVNGIHGGVVQMPALQVIPNIPRAHCIVADLTNRWVFATSLGADLIIQMEFDSGSGALVSRNVVRTKANAGPRHLALHPSGRFIYALNELDASLIGFAFDSETGGLDQRQCISMFPTNDRLSLSAADIHITPDGRFLYASERVTHTIAGFAVESDTGRLTHLGLFPTEASPRAFAISRCGRFLLAAGEISHRVATYTIDGSTGCLTKLAERSVGANPNWIEMMPLPGTYANAAPVYQSKSKDRGV